VQTKKKFNKVENQISSLLHNVKGDSKSQSVTTFISCKTLTRQVSHCAKAEVDQHRGKPNIILPPLHNVKGDSQNQSVTTFTSCKSMTRQVPCFANKKRSSTWIKTKYQNVTFT
jgi:hypothetical protein